jgi:phosphoribosyl-ATP pyrophosphohydrolase
MTDIVLTSLYDIIKTRKGGDATVSYTAKLFERGINKIAQKVGEEAVETVIAAVTKDKKEIIAESADLLFHLLVLWADQDVHPNEVLAELTKRKGTSGIDEKKTRKKE